MSKKDPIELAHSFMSLGVQDFRMFWRIVLMELNHDDSDIEAQWFYYGKEMRQEEITVIGAMHSAILAGKKTAKKKP